MVRQIQRKLRKYTLILKFYPLAIKHKGYGLRVTGDIDFPETFINNKKNLDMLINWMSLATEISTKPPVLYVTMSSTQVFKQLSRFITENNSATIVGTHSCQHLHLTQQPTPIVLQNILKCSHYSEWFRCPYLDSNAKILKLLSHYFKFDSSITSDKLYPFKIGEMWEYPVTPPSDTGFQNKPLTNHVINNYARIIDRYQKKQKFITFLFHPNNFTVNLMKNLVVKL